MLLSYTEQLSAMRAVLIVSVIVAWRGCRGQRGSQNPTQTGQGVGGPNGLVTPSRPTAQANTTPRTEVATCVHGKLEFDESMPAQLMCGGLALNPLYWNIKGASSNTSSEENIAECNLAASCTVANNSWYEAEWVNQTESALTVKHGHVRRVAGNIECSDVQNYGGGNTRPCEIRVFHVTELEEKCSLNVDTVNWTVEVVCNITKMFASDGNYECWIPPAQDLFSATNITGTLTLNDFKEDNTKYKRGTCTISDLPMPANGGHHNSSIRFNPPTESRFRYTQVLTIVRPGQPTLVNCPDYVNKGDNITCICQPANSTPPAVTSWGGTLLPNKVLEIKKYDRNSAALFYVCQQTWGNGQATNLSYRRPHTRDKTVSDCSQSWNTAHDIWNVTFTCNVDTIYASDQRYSCRWISPGTRTPSETDGDLNLSNTTAGNGSLEGTCALTAVPIFAPNGLYNYSVKLFPGDRPIGSDRFSALTLNIRQPGPPTLLNCPGRVNEGDDLNCTCQPSSSTNPKALTTWDESIRQSPSQLLIRNVSRTLDGKTYNCTQMWGGWSNQFVKRVPYTVRVSFITAISITTSEPAWTKGSSLALQDGQKNVLLTCRYNDSIGSAKLLSWCKTGSSCSQQSGIEGSISTREHCPSGSILCSTVNQTCPENIGQEVITQSCQRSKPCGMTLTIQTVTDCDAGTYACYVFSVGDLYETYSVKVTVENKGCEANTFGTNCSQTCGRCAGNQTCNTTTGHCPDCLDGWTPPLCTDAVPEEAEPLLTPNQQVVVGVTVGAPLSWAFIATLIQICQVLGNAGWLPFLHVGGKDEEGKEKGVDDDDDESSDTGPPSKCSRFLRCILCGGAGVCLLSFLFCVSCGKLMSSRFTWEKKEVDQDAAELKRRHSSIADAGTTEKQVEVVSPSEGSTDSSDATTRHLPQANTSPDNQNELFDPQEARKQSYPKGIVNAEHTRTSKFTDRYFSTLSWLESPFEDPAIARSTSTTATKMHGFYSSGFQIKKATYNRDDDANKSDQKADDQAQTVPQVKQTVDEVQNANDDRQSRDDDS